MSVKCTCLLVKGRKSCRLESWRAEVLKKESKGKNTAIARKMVSYLAIECCKHTETNSEGKL